MLNIQTDIVINANSNTIWHVLSNLSEYPSWNSFFVKMSGKLAVGETIHTTIAPPNGKPMSFAPTLITVEPGKEIRWRGKILAKWLFQGEHYLTLQPLSNGTTKFIHGEIFSGILAPIFKWFGMADTKRGFEIFNQELQQAIFDRDI